MPSPGEGARVRGRAATSATGTRREQPASSCTSGTSSTTTSTPTCFASILARAARSARLTSHFDLDFPRTPQREPYWCHKHQRICTSGRGGGQVPRPLPPRHARPDQSIPACPRVRLGRLRVAPRRCPGRRSRGRVRRAPHLAAVSRPDRLPRAASLCLRAARTGRSPRARARCCGSRNEPRGALRLRRRRSWTFSATASRSLAPRTRRSSWSSTTVESVPADSRGRRAAGRRAPGASCQSANRAAGGRVLRVGLRREPIGVPRCVREP